MKLEDANEVDWIDKGIRHLKEEFSDGYNMYLELEKELNDGLLLLQEEYDEKLNDINEKYNDELNSDDTEISFNPLRQLMLDKNLSCRDMERLTGLRGYVFKKMITNQYTDGNTTEKLALIASKLKVPVSGVVKFNGYEMTEGYEERYGTFEDFTVPHDIKGTVSYAPLYNLVESWNEYTNVQKGVHDVLRHVECSRKSHDDTESLSTGVYTKIYNNRSISLKSLYMICKYCKCSVDFVMEWE